MNVCTVEVGLGARAYRVEIGPGLLAEAGARLADLLPRRRTVVITDAHVAELHLAPLERALQAAGVTAASHVLPPGEQTKSWDGLREVCETLLEHRLDRGDLVIALGGGVIGDLVGFAAAIFKRGIDFVQIPTTLLAQVDSSVGGKTAIDVTQGKNLIGAFHQPRRVLCDLGVLATLPARELRAGFAEVLKYGLLGDEAFFAWLEAHGAAVLALDEAPLAHAVERSVAMKAEIVAQDELEAGRRALLNLGHTFAHALETETGHGEALLHGEAVGLGCALAFRFSAALGLCSDADATRASALIQAAGLPTQLCEVAGHPFAVERLIAHMAQDKKAEGGRLTFILAHGIGQAFVARGVEPEALRRFLSREGAI